MMCIPCAYKNCICTLFRTWQDLGHSFPVVTLVQFPMSDELAERRKRAFGMVRIGVPEARIGVPEARVEVPEARVEERVYMTRSKTRAQR